MSAPLLHVGYIKTATTFLQDHVFDGSVPGLALAAGRDTRGALVEDILLGDDYAFDAEATRVRLNAQAGDLTCPVWSEEMLLGNPPHRRYDGFANARKLHAVFPQARVLITIRRQDAMALSVFREYVLGGGALPLQAFIGPKDIAPGFSPVLRPEFLCFDRAIRHYQGLFGPDRVLVLPQEMLSQDPAGYFTALSDFTGFEIPNVPRDRAHVGEGAFVMGLRRRLNRFVVIDPTRPRRQGGAAKLDRVLRRLNRHLPKSMHQKAETRLSETIAARYAGVFVQSNRDTAALTGLDLERFGYSV